MSSRKWYVLYVKRQHERKVEKRINDEIPDVEAFCPTRTEIRTWSDRKKKLQVPIFNGLVFVCCEDKHRAAVFQIPGTMAYLHEQGKPGIVKNNEISHLKSLLENPNITQHTVEQWQPGNKIALDAFGFQNQEGVIQKKTKNKLWVVLTALGFVVTFQLKDDTLKTAY
ncbi:UpxY family transcription antiterminator [Bizionia sediminis]|uniref:UpxY family transcription antiterminator n=1 Tax=Bizionia sediminis TaxID=1737064 RepID=A0ABW5KWF1_9FLAO